MRKNLCLYMILVLVLTAFTGCKKYETPQIAATERTEPSNTFATETTQNTITETPTESVNDTILEPCDITDDRVTTAEKERIYKDSWLTLSLPVDWKCMERVGEDGTTYYFRNPELGENCQIVLSVTGSEYLNDRTKDQYLEYLSYLHHENIKLDSYTEEKLNGYRCMKAVYSYLSDSTEFIAIHYDNVVVGVRLYDFSITYPASGSEAFETVFASIIDSIEFLRTQ